MKKGDKENPFLDIKTGFKNHNSTLGGITTGGGIDSFYYIFSLHADKKSKFKTKNGTTPYNKSERQNLYTQLSLPSLSLSQMTTFPSFNDFMDKHSLTLDYTYNKSKHISGGTGQYHPLFG